MIVNVFHQGLECGDSIEYECDICYDMYPEDASHATCEENGYWSDLPRCLREDVYFYLFDYEEY